MIENKEAFLGNILRCFVFIALTININSFSNSQRNETSPLPENPLKGSQIFFEKGCIKCHTIWESGEAFGPDLTRIGREKDFFGLAGDLWSHSPKMIEVMREKEIMRPVLSAEEIKDLMSYLYYLGFFDELGDYLKGEEIFSKKRCSQCHSVGGSKEKRGIPLDKYGRFVSPVFIASALWNHSSTVSEAMVEQSFAPQEMSHLLAFIKGNALSEKGETVYMRPGNPNKGKEVFQKKSCAVCHESPDFDLQKSSLRKSLTEIVGMMWSHSYQMWEEMRERGLRIPNFGNEEMADLATYLYFIQYYGKRGDPAKGNKVFMDKGCLSCHSRDAVKEERGVDLVDVSGMDTFELISAMWNHVPQMERMVTEFDLAWPRFSKDEMKDLIRYIQSLK